MTEFCFDTSAWLSYALGPNLEIKKLIESDAIISISVLTLFETKRKLRRDGASAIITDKIMSFIRYRSLVVDVSKDIAEEAAELSFKYKLSTADAIIYATARHKRAELVTKDSDLEGLKGVRMVT